MNVNEILLGYLAKQYGITEEAAAELLYQPSEEDESKKVLKADALQILLDKDKERVESLKGEEVDKTAIYDEAFADAKKKILPKAEKALAKKYGIEGDKFKLETLVEDIVAKQLETAGKDASKIDEATVKRHPTYLALEKAKGEEIENLKTAHSTELETLKGTYAKTETWTDVKPLILSHFDGLNPILSTDTKKAGNQRERFATDLQGFTYEKQADNSYLIVGEDGKRLEDGHGNPLTLDKFVEQQASPVFDFKKQSAKDSAENGGGGGGGSSITVPSNQQEYEASMLNANSAAERAEIAAAYKGSE